MTGGEIQVLVEHLGPDRKPGVFSYRIIVQGGFEDEARDISLNGFICEASIAGDAPRKVFFPPGVIKAIILQRIATR